VPPTTVPPTAEPPAAAEWKPFTLYEAGQRVSYEGVTYEVLSTHTSLPGWEPTVLEILFKPV
jgi:chitin-binding protein